MHQTAVTLQRNEIRCELEITHTYNLRRSYVINNFGFQIYVSVDYMTFMRFFHAFPQL